MTIQKQVNLTDIRKLIHENYLFIVLQIIPKKFLPKQ